MGWDGAGNYTRQRNFSADASAGIKILASAMDEEIDDIASAFTNCLTRDGQNSPTGNITLGGNTFTNVGAATAVNQYLRVREFIENVPIYMQDTTTSTDTISVSAQFFTSVSAGQAPVDGTRILVRVASDKTEPVLRFSGHSANVHLGRGARVDAMSSGEVQDLIYSSAEGVWEAFTERQYYARTAAEISAGVTPTNYQYEAGDSRRWNILSDGSTNNAVALQNWLNGAAGDVTAVLRNLGGTGTIKCGSTLAIPANTRIEVYPGTVLEATTDDAPLLKGTAVSNVTIVTGAHGEIRGVQGAVDWPSPSSNAEGLVHFVNSGATNCENIRILDCHINKTWCPVSCIEVQGLWVQRCTIHNFMRYGILASKSSDFHIDYNVIYDSNTEDAVCYGITATGDVAGGSGQERCSISFNKIRGIQAWDGIMSHECTALSIIGNTIQDCRNGIDIGHLLAANVVEDVVVTGNSIDLTTTDAWSGSAAAHFGIGLEGHASTQIKNAVVSDNIVRNHGKITGATYTGVPGPLVLQNIDNLVCCGNVVSDVDDIVQANSGIHLVGNINRASITGNSLSGAMANGAIRLSSVTGDNISIVGNSIDQETASALGIYITGSTIAEIAVGLNPSNSTEPLLLDTSTVTFVQEKSESATGTFTSDIHIPITALNSAGGAVTCTLPDGEIDGQRKKVTMSDATASSTLSVTSHETSDPEVFTFAEVTDSLLLEWDAANAYWWTVKNIGAAT